MNDDDIPTLLKQQLELLQAQQEAIDRQIESAERCAKWERMNFEARLVVQAGQDAVLDDLQKILERLESVVVLLTTRWSEVRQAMDEVADNIVDLRGALMTVARLVKVTPVRYDEHGTKPLPDIHVSVEQSQQSGGVSVDDSQVEAEDITGRDKVEKTKRRKRNAGSGITG